MWRMEIKGTPAITGIPLYISNEFMNNLDETDQRCITARLGASLSTDCTNSASPAGTRPFQLSDVKLFTAKWKWSRAKGGQTRQSQPSPRAVARSLGASVLFRKYKQRGSDLCAKHYYCLGVIS